MRKLFNPRVIAACGVTLMVAFGASNASAQSQDDSPQTQAANSEERFRHFMFRVGYARLNWDEEAKVAIAGQAVPGGNARLSNNNGVEFDLAYYFNPNVSVALALGVPPTTTLTASGTLTGVGQLGKVTYGPAVATVRYHLTGLGPVVPYVGAGINYTKIFDTKDGVLQNFRASDTVGPALNAGVDVALTRRFGIYADAKKVWTSSNTRFLLPTPAGAAPGTAKVRLDPLILNAGISIRF